MSPNATERGAPYKPDNEKRNNKTGDQFLTCAAFVNDANAINSHL